MSTLVTPTDGHGGKAKILDSGSGSSSRSFAGRVAHFWSVLNPLNCLASNDELEAAKSLLTTEPKDDVLRSDEFQRAATLYESAYHPDTGERIHLVGRMCFQAPGCAVLAASMLAFHSSLPLTLGLQWANQSFMAMCNYSNRNAADERSRADASVLPAYLSATFGSMLTAWSLKKMLPKRLAASRSPRASRRWRIKTSNANEESISSGPASTRGQSAHSCASAGTQPQPPSDWAALAPYAGSRAGTIR